MNSFLDASLDAFLLLLSGDGQVWAIVGRSLLISLISVVIGAMIGIPFGTLLALKQFRGRDVLSTLTNGFMGLPPVVIGLGVFLLLARNGPFGVLDLLYTKQAMIIAQVILVTPIIAAYSRDVMMTQSARFGMLLRAYHVPRLAGVLTLMKEGRRGIIGGLLAGFGRASAEVGAVMIVGGNIEAHTRVMTTAITLETAKGNLALALGLGFVLIAMTVIVSALLSGLTRERGAKS